MKQRIKSLIRKFMNIIYEIRYIKKFDNVYLGKRVKIVRARQIRFGRNVNIQHDNLVILHNINGNLIISDGCDIGSYSRIAAISNVFIDKNVITGPNVFIADYNHNYLNIDVPIKSGGNIVYDKGIRIGEGSWIGTNSVIVGNVSIGKHCVIGANSVVTKDIPDYCVVVGSPAKIIKKYDLKTMCWKKQDEL